MNTADLPVTRDFFSRFREAAARGPRHGPSAEMQVPAANVAETFVSSQKPALEDEPPKLRRLAGTGNGLRKSGARFSRYAVPLRFLVIFECGG